MKRIILLLLILSGFYFAYEKQKEENTKVMISFVFDTEMKEQYTIAKPLFDKRGWKFALALDVVHLDSKNKEMFMSMKEIKSFMDTGYEVINHSKFHTPLHRYDEKIPKGLTHQGVYVNDFLAYDEIYGAHINLLENSFMPVGFVGSNSLVDDRYVYHIKDLYAFGYTEPESKDPKKVIFNNSMNRYKLRRFSLEQSTLSEQKKIVNNLIELGGNHWLTFYHHKADDIEALLLFLDSKKSDIEIVLPSVAVQTLTGYSSKYERIINKNLLYNNSFDLIDAKQKVLNWSFRPSSSITLTKTDENRLKMNFKNKTSKIGDRFVLSQKVYVDKFDNNYTFSIDVGSTTFITENIFESYIGIKEYDENLTFIDSREVDYTMNVDIAQRRFFLNYIPKSRNGYLEVYIKFKTKIVPSKNHYFTFFKPKLEIGEEYSLYE